MGISPNLCAGIVIGGGSRLWKIRRPQATKSDLILQFCDIIPWSCERCRLSICNYVGGAVLALVD